MGWAAHGDRCRGFHGATDAEMQAKLERTVGKRRGDFPQARHFVLFATEREVTVKEAGSR